MQLVEYCRCDEYTELYLALEEIRTAEADWCCDKLLVKYQVKKKKKDEKKLRCGRLLFI